MSIFFARLVGLGNRLRSAARTLRVRLMIWNAGLVLATAVACFLGIREGLRAALVTEMDRVLFADLREISLEVADLHATASDIQHVKQFGRSGHAVQLLDDLSRKASGHQQNGWFVELLDKDDKVLWASDEAVPDVPKFESAPTSWNGYRIHESGKLTAAGPIRIRVGAPMEFIDRDIERIDRLAEFGVAVMLIVAPLAGYWLAGRAVRPLGRIIETTARLRPNRMDERLPIRQTGDELDKLSWTVNQFLDRIAAYLSQSNDLLANSAHELRTPLAAIRSSVEVALGGNRTPQEYQELLSELIEECGSLERLVNQLLLLAESDSERLRAQSEKFALSDLVNRCVEMFSAAAEARQIELRSFVEAQVEAVGVRSHVRQVINNLIDNSLKFTKPQGNVSVSVFRDADGAAVFRVRDTGCGIPAADLPHVFERFFRGDKSRQRVDATSGTGLGLSICRAIVNAHGGQILVESREDAGTCVTVRVPSTLPVSVTSGDPNDMQESAAAVVPSHAL
jgi:signal transduction histidine kinase